ncbi:hypothetical protein, partial [Cutibacterium granulosum]|uniref:hypothetical protein n=1 Tax=Cutibacterium granulosum TaxID=33011 RepID=UPI001F2CE529
MANPVRVAMPRPIVVILRFLFFGVSHVLMVFLHSPVIQPTRGEDETHEGNSCTSMMTLRCHMNDQENDCPDGSDDGAEMRPLRGARR